jgi:hypothetical protein
MGVPIGGVEGMTCEKDIIEVVDRVEVVRKEVDDVDREVKELHRASQI